MFRKIYRKTVKSASIRVLFSVFTTRKNVKKNHFIKGERQNYFSPRDAKNLNPLLLVIIDLYVSNTSPCKQHSTGSDSSRLV